MILLRFLILFVVFLAQYYTTALENEAHRPLDIFYKEENEFNHACRYLKAYYEKLSEAAAELLEKDTSKSHTPIAVATEHGQSDEVLNRFNIVVYEIDTKHVTMAVLITKIDQQEKIFVLDYYMGFNIGGLIIHKLYSMAMAKITTENNATQRKKYHSWLTSFVFQGYQAATEKWKHVRYNPIGMDFGIREAYRKVKDISVAAANDLAKDGKYKILVSLANAIQQDFEEVDSNGDVRELKKTEHPDFTILQYMKQEVDDIDESGKPTKEKHTGFIIQINGPFEYVLGVTIYKEKIFTEFSLQGNQQKSSNPYNVFLLKCQTLANYFRDDQGSFQKNWIEGIQRGIFGENPYLKDIPLAKFGLTYTPGKTSIAWTAFECGFFDESITVVDKEVSSKYNELTDMEKKFLYSRCNSNLVNKTWSEIKTLESKGMSIPAASAEAMGKEERKQTTWVQRQNKFLEEGNDRTRRKDRTEWEGLHVVDWVAKLPADFPLANLNVTPDPPLWFSGPNPVVDVIINIPVKDRKGKYVLTRDGNLRWNTITGRRGRPPWQRQLHGGFVEINKEIEDILEWIFQAHGKDIRKTLVEKIWFLNGLKEFLEESKGILNLVVDERIAMWQKIVKLLFVDNKDRVICKEIFQGSNGDLRNQTHSYTYSVVYAIYVIDSPDFEEFVDEPELIGGDDNVESTKVTLSNRMTCFASHELFFLRNLRERPTRVDVIKSLNGLLQSDTRETLQTNLNLLKEFVPADTAV